MAEPDGKEVAREASRLAALRKSNILDTPAEAAFDRITRVAARSLRVPIAIVSFVDERRQWFKSALGLPIRQSPVEHSFCARAIRNDGATVIPDTIADARFRDNPFVTELGIRFYAGAPLKSRDGHALGTLCIMDRKPRDFSPDERELLRDLAAVVESELELRHAVRERAQQTAAISSLRTGVLITDPNLPDNPVVFANPGFSGLTGFTPDEILGRNCRFLQGPATDPAVVQSIHEAIQNRTTFHGTLVNYRRDGTAFWNELVIAPVFDAHGELINFVGLQTDISERKRIADELEQSYQKLQALERLRDNLTDMIVHDLRSPLTTIAGYIELVRDVASRKFTPAELNFVEKAEQSSLSLQRMITSLLDVSRLENGQMPLQRQQHDLGAILRAAVDPVVPLLGNRRFVQSMPETPITVTCDAQLIQRVMENLLNNAVKFTPPEGEIRLQLTPQAPGARVMLTDTGTGIPEQYHSTIFEKFAQVDSRRFRHSTGLGLAFCRLAIEAHGGRIGVESQPGKGSTFWFELPA